MGTYVEAFMWHLENRMESPKVEQAEAAKDLMIEWLTMADNEIDELTQTINMRIPNEITAIKTDKF